MKSTIRKKLASRKRRIKRRIDKTKFGDECPVISASNIDYEIADRTRAISAGGIGIIHRLAKRLRLDEMINRSVPLLKMYLPYSESDHVLNIAYNLLVGGTCLEHLELRRNDEAYLDALGAQRIPDPTTAGDFCRRFEQQDIAQLMDAFNDVRLKVWKQQPPEFFEEALVDADGTIVETTGECKEGMDMSYKGKWGYHPLVVSLANTGEPLFLVNRPGNRNSAEGAAAYLDQSVALCRRAGFRRITLRGDTDFSQSEHLDRWDKEGVFFVFGFDAKANLVEIAENLPDTAWRKLERRPKVEAKTKPRSRPRNVKEDIVRQREYKNISLQQEYVAEFEYSPKKCDKTYRVVVVWKDVDINKGQLTLWDETRCFFYITNDRDRSAEKIVYQSNQRCNQENTIEQLKNDVHALTAPLDNLISNWAYMVIASLAASLKAWAALLLPANGRWKDQHEEEKHKLLWMDFSTFRNAWINMPAQIIRGGRRIVYRLLSWNPWQAAFFRLLDVLKKPLRC